VSPDHKSAEFTILVVDDDRELRLFAEALLQDLGHSVLLADSGRSAVALLLENPCAVNAVLLDMAMPGMAPEETFRHIRAICPALPVIILSGQSAAAISELFSPGTIAGYILKPYTDVELTAALSSALSAPVTAAERGFQLQPLSDFDRRDLAQQFLTARKIDLARMTKMLADSDFEHLWQLSHTLKGGGGCFGFMDLTRLGSELERYARASDAASCGEQLSQLKDLLGNLIPE
jgi:CheY-like chemotaxis protein